MQKLLLAAMSLAAALSVLGPFAWQTTAEQNTAKVFVVNWHNQESSVIYRVEESIRGLIPIATGFDHLLMGSCSPSGLLYFTEYGKQRILRIGQDGQHPETVIRYSVPKEKDVAISPIFDAQGNLYYTFEEAGGVWRIKDADPSKNATQVVKQFGVAGGWADSWGMAFLNSGPFAGELLGSRLAT